MRWRVGGWGWGWGGGRWWLVGGGEGQIYFLSTWVFLEHSGSKTAEIKKFVAGGLTKFPHLWFSWKADCVSGVNHHYVDTYFFHLFPPPPSIYTYNVHVSIKQQGLTNKVALYLNVVAICHFIGQAFQGSPLLHSVNFFGVNKIILSQFIVKPFLHLAPRSTSSSTCSSDTMYPHRVVHVLVHLTPCIHIE